MSHVIVVHYRIIRCCVVSSDTKYDPFVANLLTAVYCQLGWYDSTLCRWAKVSTQVGDDTLPDDMWAFDHR